MVRKSAAVVSGRFPDFLIIKNITTNEKIRKPAGNLRGRFPEVSSRFPDNPSLTDHTVCTLFHREKENCFITKDRFPIMYVVYIFTSKNN